MSVFPHRPGDRVFAKIKGFSNWPARINPLPSDVQIPKGKLPVFFYGTYQVSFVPAKNIVPYDEFKAKWGKPKSNPQFMAALEEIESNPGVLMLGEDPRAEQFLLQFYTFKPSAASTVPSSRKTEQPGHRKSQSPNSPRSFSSMSSSPTHGPSSRSVKTHSTQGSKTGLHSETSSELSSEFSKQGSTEVTAVSDDEDNLTVVERRQSESKSRGSHHIQEHPGTVPSVKANGNDQDEFENYEAQKLARHLQKKAERKALKKAAKKEAKRLAKEAERAERRARREAKREQKRLHKLEKQRLLNQEMSANQVPPFDLPDTQWAATFSDSHLDLHGAPLFSPSADLPYDDLIAAELEGSGLSPSNDRTSSPLRLDYFIPDNLSQEEPNPDTTIAMKEGSTSPASHSPVRDRTLVEDNRKGSKRGTSSSPTACIEPPGSDSSSTIAIESELPPKKRAKAEPVRTSQKHPARTPKEDAEINVRSSRSRSSPKSHKRVTARRRRRRFLAEDDDDDDDDGGGEEEKAAVKPHPMTDPHENSPQAETSPRSKFLKDAGKPRVVEDHPPFVHSPTKPLDRSPMRTSVTEMGNSTEGRIQSGDFNGPPPPPQAVKQNVKASDSPASSVRPASPNPPDVVTHLRQLGRELKANLVRGHENFTAAVQHLTQLTTLSIRLPQLAQVWDLMDCIKKCRRYKLSAEVREAAQNTLRFFQSVQSSATKEELAQTQALIAAHQNRAPTTSCEAAKKSPKEAPGHTIDLTKVTTDTTTTTTTTTTVPALANPPIQSTSSITSPTPVDSKTVDSTNADLAAKVDDMLSLIRATEERMAAASYATGGKHSHNKTSTTHSGAHDIGSAVSRHSDVAYDIGHNIIRASAVAAAAAHMHDEEDEDAVVSRIEQVAAFEEATKSSASQLSSHQSPPTTPPPPPPPPPPPLPSSSFGVHRLSPALSAVTDLDLDSRIELLITGPKPSLGNRTPKPKSSPLHETRNSSTGPSTHHGGTLPSSLLARRQAIADKLAAKRAARSAHEHARSSSGNDAAISNRQPASKDDELYDLLGV